MDERLVRRENYPFSNNVWMGPILSLLTKLGPPKFRDIIKEKLEKKLLLVSNVI